MSFITGSSDINTEDFINPKTDEYLYLDLVPVIPRFEDLNSLWSESYVNETIEQDIIPSIKKHHGIKSAYFKKYKGHYKMSILGFLELVNQMILPSNQLNDLNSFNEFINFIVNSYFDTIRHINRDYQYKLHKSTQSVSEIADTLGKDAIWLNQQLKKMGYIYREDGDWYPDKDLIKQKLAVSVNYHNLHYVRWTVKGVEMILKSVPLATDKA